MRFLQTYDILSVSDLKLTEVKDGKEMVKLRGLYKISALALSVMIVAGAGNLAQMTNSDVYAGTASGTATTDRVVSTDGTTWRYLDNNTKPEAGWNSDADFDDSAWSSGKGSFGAKNGQKADLGSGFVPNVLLNQYISGTSNDVPVYYLRTKFDIDDVDVSQIKEITGTVLYDDAAIVTINGKKIAGFDDSSFDENGYGGSNAGEPKTGTVSAVSDGIDISSLNLKAKDNVLAVELHQGRASSSDIYVDLQDLTVSTVLPQKEVRDVSLQIGADETKRNLSWLGESGKASYVQVAVKPSGWKNGDEFPETSARKCRADQVKSGVSGFYSNKAVLKNLDEFTTYIYRVGNDDGWSDTYTFATQDLGEKDSFSFLFVFYFSRLLLRVAINMTTADALKHSSHRSMLFSSPVFGAVVVVLPAVAVVLALTPALPPLPSSSFLAALIVNSAVALPSSNSAINVCLPTDSVSRKDGCRSMMTLPLFAVQFAFPEASFSVTDFPSILMPVKSS